MSFWIDLTVLACVCNWDCATKIFTFRCNEAILLSKSQSCVGSWRAEATLIPFNVCHDIYVHIALLTLAFSVSTIVGACLSFILLIPSLSFHQWIHSTCFTSNIYSNITSFLYIITCFDKLDEWNQLMEPQKVLMWGFDKVKAAKLLIKLLAKMKQNPPGINRF